MTVLNRALARRLPAIHENQNLEEARHACADPALGVAVMEAPGGLTLARCAAHPDAEAFNMVSHFRADAVWALAEAAAWFDAAGCGAHVRVAGEEAGPAVSAALIALGFHVDEIEAWLWARPDAIEPPLPGGGAVTLAETPQARAVWADVAVRGWELSPDRAALARASLTPPEPPSHWRYLIAARGGEPVGEALMTLNGEIAYLADAAVPPEHRGLGVQRDLIRARAGLAREAGCTVMFAGARFGSASHVNMERAGLSLAQVTELWFRPPQRSDG